MIVSVFDCIVYVPLVERTLSPSRDNEMDEVSCHNFEYIIEAYHDHFRYDLFWITSQPNVV